MPELPEVQALAERIHTRLAGAVFVRAEPLSFSALKTVTPSPENLEGKRLAAVGRRGKFLVFEMERYRLAVHLSQGGRVDLVPGSVNSRPKGGVTRLRFDRDPALLVKEFGTERKAGWWVLAPGDEGPMAKLGPEPFSQEFHDLVMAGTDTRRLHAMLRDQRQVAGIGRGYADDILHRAKLSPYRSLSSLAEKEREDMLEAVHGVLTDGLEAERRRPAGLPPKLGDHWVVHGRWGTPCPVCGSDLRRVSYESHEVTYCPTCQTGGRVLADRRLSRLIK
ncbi:MAG TPA: DNA-formamidopyrimidine glycosylase family protein [Actinomycetota bacterium]|nr:DNA-formamidopyrimidine glycosylase family protein [Actinomycetota bacterium]